MDHLFVELCNIIDFDHIIGYGTQIIWATWLLDELMWKLTIQKQKIDKHKNEVFQNSVFSNFLKLHLAHKQKQKPSQTIGIVFKTEKKT